jgi:prepilin-type processing-associated H-X9-DG protein
MQCTNHLKQIGLGVHNFHDSQGGLPPSTIGWHRATFWALFLPYMEQTANYDLIVGTGDPVTISTWWTQGQYPNGRTVLTDTTRNGIGSIPWYKCPTRRSGVAVTDANGFNGGGAMAGPQGDYAIVYSTPTMLNSGTRASGETTWCTDGDIDCWVRDPRNSRVNGPRIAAAQRGPFRAARVTEHVDDNNPRFATWKTQDTFSRWADGTSSQIIVGEKHIPFGKVGECDPAKGSAFAFDCSILCSHNNTDNSGQHGRAIQQGVVSATDNTPYHRQGVRLLRSQDHVSGVTVRDSGFGSYHPGTCNFLLGDGSVQAFGLTTGSEALASWANVNSGRSVSL